VLPPVDLRPLVPRLDFAAPPLPAPVLLLRGEDERALPLLAALPRVLVDLRPVEVEPVPPLLPRALPDLAEDARPPVERVVDDLALLLRDARPLLEDEDEDSSDVHLPVSMRCAASATASAMMEPSLVALDTMLDAVSAASRPASRILRRAAGLALIAAAAAARPAASISLLIAALASLSTVSLPVIELASEFWFGRFAIAFLLPLWGKRHMTAVTVP
jgi:hypothetical protein